MSLRKWEDLPSFMKNEEVKKYYQVLDKKRKILWLKRLFDLILSIILLIMFLPVFIVISIAIKLDSKGPIMFRQTRVTQYGKKFRIFKFRTMIENADKIGEQLTSKDDVRVTKVGNIIRKIRLDELPQLLNIILGDMTFVGTRPEVPKYVDEYTNEMLATLLLPAGVTSEASIKYKDEDVLLAKAIDIERVYVQQVLPGKMEYNLKAIHKTSFFYELNIMFQTFTVLVGK